MDKNILEKILNAEPMSFTVAEIEQIMDEELEKTPEEMDTDIIDICVEVLEKAYSKAENVEAKNEGNKKRVKFKRFILIAAVVGLISAFAVPVGAKYINRDVSDEIVKSYGDHFEISLLGENNGAIDHSDENSDIIKLLNEMGIENVILPSELLKEEYVKEITYFDENAVYIMATIDFENSSNKIKGQIVITKDKLKETGFTIGQDNIPDTYDSVKQFTLNGMDIIVFSNNVDSYIEYIDNNIKYQIYIPKCEFYSVVEISMTLE